jgi:hypothetical protein
VTKVAQITEYRYEPLRLEREGVNVERGAAEGRVRDALVVDLVREERGDDSEEPRDELVVTYDVQGD